MTSRFLCFPTLSQDSQGNLISTVKEIEKIFPKFAGSAWMLLQTLAPKRLIRTGEFLSRKYCLIVWKRKPHVGNSPWSQKVRNYKWIAAPESTFPHHPISHDDQEVVSTQCASVRLVPVWASPIKCRFDPKETRFALVRKQMLCQRLAEFFQPRNLCTTSESRVKGEKADCARGGFKPK